MREVQAEPRVSAQKIYYVCTKTIRPTREKKNFRIGDES